MTPSIQAHVTFNLAMWLLSNFDMLIYSKQGFQNTKDHENQTVWSQVMKQTKQRNETETAQLTTKPQSKEEEEGWGKEGDGERMVRG